jgi:hypothetical protein
MTAQAITQAATVGDPLTPPPARKRHLVTPAVRCIATATAHRAEESPGSRIAELQRRMARAEASIRGGAPRSLVVLPSRTIDKWHEPPAEAQAYEERLLCSLFELRDPNLRMTYVTSAPISPAIVDYYLSLIPRRMRTHARSRLTLVALGDRTRRPLSEKLLERPQVLARMRGALGDADTSYLLPYNTTCLERDVALALGIPMFGSDPRHAYLGTKSGCRSLFARAGIPHPAGVEGIAGVTDAIEAIVKLRAAKRGLSRLVMKLNEGVSGDGNAIIDLRGLPDPGAADERGHIAERVSRLAPEAHGVTAAAFLAKLARRGGIVEEWITGRELRSPSVQLQIMPSGQVQLLSTHDQILGGSNGQSYLGCRFPAAPSYAPTISSLAERVGNRLAGAGVIGRFAIDFVVARDEHNRWQPFAIELNLRKGGTTHPYETLVHLTGGSYDPASATFTTPTGQQKHYVATDHMEAPQLRTLGHAGVIALSRRAGLRFDRMRRIGTVFHMLSSLEELGRAGFTVIADGPDEADQLYQWVRARLLAEADHVTSSRGPTWTATTSGKRDRRAVGIGGL